MNIKKLQRAWDNYGKENPFWAVLTTDEDWNERRFFSTGQREIDDVFRYLHKQKVAPRKGRALDFGCGVGRLTRPLGKYFSQVVGVDISPSMIDEANQLNRGRTKLRFVLNTEANLKKLGTNSFDFVYSHITLQHIRADYSAEYIREFVRVLKPGGILLFQIPSSKKAKYSGLRPILRRINKVGFYSFLKERFGETRMEMHTIPREEIIDLLEQSGAAIKDIQPDKEAGLAWISYRYLAQKNR